MVLMHLNASIPPILASSWFLIAEDKKLDSRDWSIGGAASAICYSSNHKRTIVIK